MVALNEFIKDRGCSFMRWLHISDIHIGNIPFGANYETFVRKFCEEVKEKLNEPIQKIHEEGEGIPPSQGVWGIDCIIYTGDLFHQGNCDHIRIKNAQYFFRELYQTCSDVGNWNWQEDAPMNRLFYCPGNHDVLRDAYIQSEEGILYHRKNELNNSAKDGCFSCNSIETLYSLYTERNFQPFDVVMKNIGNIRNELYQSSFPYEYRVFTVPDNEFQMINVIGLNTALGAGRISSQETISNCLVESFDSFWRSHLVHDTKEALEAYKSYHQIMQNKHGQLGVDFGNLCFISQPAKKSLRENVKLGRKSELKSRIPIVFGHHPINFLSVSSQGEFADLMDSINAHIYLCGHMHKSSAEKRNHDTPWYQIGNVYQITVGGIFMDESQYNLPSFSIGSVIENAEGRAELTVSIFTYMSDPFGRQKWIESSLHESFPIDHPSPRRQNDPLDDYPPYDTLAEDDLVNGQAEAADWVREIEYPDDHKNRTISDEDNNNVYQKLLSKIKKSNQEDLQDER